MKTASELLERLAEVKIGVSMPPHRSHHYASRSRAYAKGRKSCTTIAVLGGIFGLAKIPFRIAALALLILPWAFFYSGSGLAQTSPNPSVFANGGSSATELSGALTMTHSMVDCETNFAEQADDNWRVSEWFNSQRGNRVGNANMSSYINSSAVNAMTPATLDDPFFDQVDYVGAVKDADSDWTHGWTFRGWENYNSQ